MPDQPSAEERADHAERDLGLIAIRSGLPSIITDHPTMRKWSLRMVFAIVLLTVCGEVVLRMRGYDQLPVFVADPRFEYMTAPGQDLHAGGVRFTTNAFGMRCGPIGAKKRKRVLVIGDSVINGGLSSTQDSLATSIAAVAAGAEVLNCSAPSWGPDNAAAFLDAHGLFDADLVIAVFSSHDAFDRMTFEPIVGHHPAYPDHRPLLALEAYVDKLLSTASGTPSASSTFNEGWKRSADQARAAILPFVVVLHPETLEVEQQRYDARGQQVLDSLRAWRVPVVEMLGRMNSRMYWDNIHLNDHGQRALGAALEVIIRSNGGN